MFCASSMVVGSFLLLVSVSLRARAAATREGMPRVSMGREVHTTANLEVKGAIRPNTRATMEQNPTAWGEEEDGGKGGLF